MIFPSLEDAILAINKDAKFIFRDDDVKKIEWLDGTSSIPQSEITNKLNALNTEFELQFLLQLDKMLRTIENLYSQNMLRSWEVE